MGAAGFQTRRRLGAILACLWALGLGYAAPAAAHAHLLGATPTGGSEVAAPPPQITLRFSEAIDPALSTAEAFDQTAAPLPVDVEVHAEPPELILTPKSTWAKGQVTILWTAFSVDDGHITHGETTFGIGVPPRAAGVSQRGLPPAWLDAGQIVARWLAWLGLTLWAGAAFWRGVLLRRGPASDRHPLDEPGRRLTRAGAALFALGTLLVIAVSGLMLAGGPLPGTAAWSELVLATRAGRLDLLQFGAGLLGVFGASSRGLSAAAVALAAAAGALAGHALSLGIPVDWAVIAAEAHLVAALVWIGGMLFIATVLGRAAAVADAGEWLRLVRRFSPWAAGGAAIVILSGILNTYFITGRLLPAWVGAYDPILWLKIGLVAVIAALSARHLRLRLRRPAGAIWRPWRRLIRAQSALAVGVLLAAAALINQSPPLQSGPGGSLDLWVAEGAGPYEVIAHLDPGRRTTRTVVQVRDARAAPLTDAQVSAAFGESPAIRLHRTNSGDWSGALRTPQGSTALRITVARPGEPQRTAVIPLQLPFRAADAELKAATARFLQLKQAREVQNVSSGGLVVQTRFEFAAPDRVHYTLSSGRETIGGPEGRRWDRADPEAAWVMGDWPSDYRWPVTDWSLDAVRSVRHIGTEPIDGRLCDVLALVDTRGDGVYFRLWIDRKDGLLRRERMVTTAHFMTAEFSYPAQTIAIVAPAAPG